MHISEYSRLVRLCRGCGNKVYYTFENCGWCGKSMAEPIAADWRVKTSLPDDTRLLMLLSHIVASIGVYLGYLLIHKTLDPPRNFEQGLDVFIQSEVGQSSLQVFR